MKKNNAIGVKGFAMSELLAASIVILLLFTILFANYLPLVAEFENRSLYNNVTANYGLFYVRKIYRSALEDTSTKQVLDNGLTTSSFYTVYKTGIQPQLVSNDAQEQLNNIINEYKIEEIIISKYKLNDLKDNSKGYKKSDGLLYKYIKYLPFYSKGEFGVDQISEPYRLIIKTKDYGYATTKIIPDPPVPINCFTLSKVKDREFTVIDYNKDCSDNVIITSDTITYNNEEGIITSITGAGNKGAFEDKNIKSITLSNKIKTIGDNAFKNNELTNIDFDKDAPSVETIGKNAFSNNKLNSVEITSSIKTIGKGAFANNYSLKTISFAGTDDFNISDRMFALDTESPNYNYNNLNAINIYIPYNVNTIGKSAFENLKFSSIEFENGDNKSQVSEIGKSAFSTQPNNQYISLSIPKSVSTIGESAFNNVRLGSLVFETDDNHTSQLKSISNYAFSNKNIVDLDDVDKGKFCSQGCEEYTRKVEIPTNVTTIGEQAFKNQLLSSIIFEKTDNEGNIINKSKLINIGDQAFEGNSFNTITLPESFGDQNAKIGKQIFGDDSLGNTEGQILIKRDLLEDTYWCTLLYGEEGCTSEEVELSNNKKVFMYKFGTKTKYITYLGPTEG